jgi:hypothetical protein
VTIELCIERAVAVAFVTAGLSHLLHPKLWGALLHELLAGRYVPLLIAAYSLPVGLLIVAGHNIWAWDVRLLTTVAGWIMTVKSIVYLLYPRALWHIAPADLRGRKFALHGAVMAGLGGWMAWGAFHSAL